MNSYFRLDYATTEDLDTWTRARRLPERPVDLPMKVRNGNFVLVANFNHAARLGEVCAIGRIVRATGHIEVDWRRAEFDLCPSPQGEQFWNRDHFKFAATVVDRYMLEAIFAEHFLDSGRTQSDKSVTTPRGSVPLSGGTNGALNAGHVYVIRSPYGYKIEKTRTLRDRTRLFAVKLPFPIELVITGWFADYPAAELQLHRRFANKRLKGKWFDLNDSDLKVLQAELPIARTS